MTIQRRFKITVFVLYSVQSSEAATKPGPGHGHQLFLHFKAYLCSPHFDSKRSTADQSEASFAGDLALLNVFHETCVGLAIHFTPDLGMAKRVYLRASNR